MDEYPDPDEEYELMYADELELLQESDAHLEPNVIKKKSLPAKRSLDFSSPVGKGSPPASQQSNSLNIINTQATLSQPLEQLEDVLTSVPTSNKRTVNDLFGDISDIEFDNIQLPSKRQKTEEEIDLELINKIIESRKLKQLLSEPKNRAKTISQSSYNIKENISLNIPRWAFIPITNVDGDRMYVRLESEESWDNAINPAVQPSVNTMLINSATWEEARKMLDTKLESVSSNTDLNVEFNANDANLWVEKYKPVSYVDLLSEEPVNRAVLHWLHLWDKVVFKKDVKTKEPQLRNSFSKKAGQFQLTNKWKGKKEEAPELDEDGRPHHKVALLCGPPGVGKTTLAHLLAKLAGYRPVELNASDERSTEAFRTALQNATLMTSVLDAERRPNCLILDEIDGAPLATVELLVKWCTATGAATGKKKGKTQVLRRPVIAICNDLYASSLRPLRGVSAVVRVGGCAGARLAARLSRVCRGEGVRAAPRELAALAARAAGDVRHAIQLLSFVKARPGAQLTMKDVENAAIGTKDCSKSCMQALQAVFSTDDGDPSAIHKTIQAAGDYDRIIDGIFENYLSARVDAHLLIACETLSWLRFYDSVYAWTMRNQNYSLYGMLPMCIVRCHKLLASRTSHRLQFPLQAQEVHRKRTEVSSIVQAVWAGRDVRVGAGRTALSLDVIPLLPYLLSPTLRSANVQLCSEAERRMIRSCVGGMCDYGLRYVQLRTPDGLYAFQLDPDIYTVAFLGNEVRSRPSPAVRQALAREQQLEIIRRNEEMTCRVTTKDKKNDNNIVAQSRDTTKDVAKETPLPNHLQRLKPKEIEKKAPQVHKDFFGRVVPITTSQRSDAVQDVISSSNIFYQYREGFNNAVRRKVRTKDIL